jgi:hypothetical protein
MSLADIDKYVTFKSSQKALNMETIITLIPNDFNIKFISKFVPPPPQTTFQWLEMEVHNCYIDNVSKLKVCFQKFIYTTKIFVCISFCVIYYIKYKVYCKYLNPNHENSFTMFIKGDFN